MPYIATGASPKGISAVFRSAGGGAFFECQGSLREQMDALERLAKTGTFEKDSATQELL